MKTLNPEWKTHADRDREIISNAAYFTSVVFLGRARRDKRIYKTQEGAVIGARLQANFFANGRGSMVYAVTPQGHDCLVTTVKPTVRRRVS